MIFEPAPPRGVMFLGAHPDDETIMAGGTLAMLAQHDIPVHVVCATDGRGGEAGGLLPDTPQQPLNRDRLAALRMDELYNACLALGVQRVLSLGYVDPVIGPNDMLYPFAPDENELVLRLADIIWVRGVDVVLTHGTDGEYGHPAHKQMHRAVLKAVQQYVPHVTVYSVAASVPEMEVDRLWNTSDPAHLALNITPWAEAKIAAMEAHRSQHALFKRRRKLNDVAQALRSVESFRRQWPAPRPGRPLRDPFAHTLRKAGAWEPVRDYMLHSTSITR